MRPAAVLTLTEPVGLGPGLPRGPAFFFSLIGFLGASPPPPRQCCSTAAGLRPVPRRWAIWGQAPLEPNSSTRFLRASSSSGLRGFESVRPQNRKKTTQDLLSRRRRASMASEKRDAEIARPLGLLLALARLLGLGGALLGLLRGELVVLGHGLLGCRWSELVRHARSSRAAL